MADERMRTGESRTPQPDWASRVTAVVESVVELIRDKSLRPALVAVKLILIGLVATAIAMMLLVLGIVGVVRLLTHAFGGRVWAADLVVGGALALAGGGLFQLSKRTMKADTHV